MIKEKLKVSNILYFLVIIMMSIVTAWLLFGKLGIPEIQETDEACHGINAYEMIQQGSIIVNYLKHEVDYFNSKPPLMLWSMMICYKIFGVSVASMRLPSAIAGLLLFFWGIFFTHKYQGKVQTLFWVCAFPILKQLFDFHMFRAGEMDSMYTLFFGIGLIGLLWALKNPTKGAILYGAGLGLCFMTKGTHMYTMVLIGLLFIPVMHKYQVKFRHYIYAVLVFLAIVMPWAILRFRFDGLEFFRALFITETNLKVSMSDPMGPLIDYVKTPAITIALIIDVIGLIVWLIFDWKKGIKKSENANEQKVAEMKADMMKSEKSDGGERKEDKIHDASIKEAIKEVITPVRYLLLIWILVVLICNTAIGIFFSWYIYSAYIATILLSADVLAYLVNKARGRMGFRIAAVLMFCVMIGLSFGYLKANISINGYGGSNVMNFLENNEELAEKTDKSLTQCPAYIELADPGYWDDGAKWQLDYVFGAETQNDVLCVDGGVQAFLDTENMDAILYLDKPLWDQYSSVLAGHIILLDDEFLVFNKHYYGE